MRRQTAWVAAGVIIVLIGGWVVFQGLPDLLARELGRGFGAEAAEKARTEVRTTALQFIGGLVLTLTGIVTALTLRQTRARDEEQRRANDERIRIDREGQITERFTRAIDQLASDGLDVKLGGIHGLERIARDSPKDHAAIFEVLTAYVRANAPWPPPTASASRTTSSDATPAGPPREPTDPMDEMSGDLRPLRMCRPC